MAQSHEKATANLKRNHFAEDSEEGKFRLSRGGGFVKLLLALLELTVTIRMGQRIGMPHRY